MMLRYFMAIIAAAILLIAPAIVSANGDDDHDHGATANASAPVGAKPRIEARTATVELVAAVDGDDLTIWIDGWADNAPITNANVNVTIDGQSQPAKSAGGVYTLSDPKLESAGAHQLAFLITRAGAIESLSAELVVPQAKATAAAGGWTYWFVAAGIAVLAIFGLIFRRSRKAGAALAITAIGLLLLQPRPILAHGDEDHSAKATSTKTIAGGGGDAAARLPNGGVFAPKGVQRIIGLRTIVAVDGYTRPSANLTGQIIADPRRGGLVQSSTGGRVSAGGSGIAVIGQSVRAGQILAIIEPPLQAIDRASLSRELGDLDQQIALAANRAARLRRLEGVVPRREIEEAGITLRGLQSRRAGLGQATSAREVLRAPISGVISVSGVRVGQVVAAQTTLFEIVDPSRLYVEANLFDRRPIVAGASAVGKTSDGATFDLVFEGAGLADRGRAAQGLFRIVGAPPRLRIGESITIAAPLGEPVAGVIVPRAALASGTNGLTSVFVKTRAEAFRLRNVTTAPVDANNVAILTGVKAEERVVTIGATLLGQVR